MNESPQALAGMGRESDVAGSIAGAGASSQAAAMEVWIAGFSALAPDAMVTYDPSGSGAGRDQFLAGGVAFAGSDAALDGEELTQAHQRCGGVDNLIQIPAYISPIAVIYNLDGVDNLRLSASTIAKIFTGRITTWNDPAITAENPGMALPALPITPVHRSDESGTTENFTEYLAAAAGPDWPYPPDGDWPIAGGEAAQGTAGVVSVVQAGNGTIGYADASQAGELGTVAVKVGNEYVKPTPAAAAAVLEASSRLPEAGKFDFAVEIARNTTQAGTYPIVLVSYELACTSYPDPATAAVTKDFLDYVISVEGQQSAAQLAGNAPISGAQRERFQQAVDAITVASSEQG